MGARKRIDGQIVDVANIYSGGRLGDEAELGELTTPNVTMIDLPEQVADQIRALRGDEALIARSEPVLAD